MSITIEINICVVNSLDTTFGLINDNYKPYWKPNDNQVYINKNSTHPPIVLRQLAKSISKIYKESIPIYQEALKKSGFHEKAKYVREEVDKHGKEEKKDGSEK